MYQVRYTEAMGLGSFANGVTGILLAAILLPDSAGLSEQKALDNALAFLERAKKGIENAGNLDQSSEVLRDCSLVLEQLAGKFQPEDPKSLLLDLVIGFRSVLTAAKEGKLLLYCREDPERVRACLDFFQGLAQKCLGRAGAIARNSTNVFIAA